MAAKTPSKARTWTMLIGIAVGSTLTGLVLPFAVGEPVSVSSGVTDPGALGDRSSSTEQASSSEDETQLAGADDLAGGSAAAASTSAATTATAAGAPSNPASTAPLTASDQGVTPTSIKIGLLLLDVGSIGGFGVGVPGIDPDEQRVFWQVYVDDLNRRGGINGRKIEAVYATYDVFSADSMRAACVRLTEDAKVFAVFDTGGFQGGPVLCVTNEHRVPLLVPGVVPMPRSWYVERSGGYLFSWYMSAERLTANLAAELEGLGRLRGRTIGILGDKRPGQPETADLMVAALGDLGYEVAHRASLSEDLNTGASQIPVEVQQMRSAGVDAVILLTQVVYATQFVQSAESQRYQPKYYASDASSGSTDTYVQNMPDSFDALALTATRVGEWRVGQPEPALDAACRAMYEKATGQKVDRSQNQYGYLRACSMLQMFETAATAAGPTLTRQGYVDRLSRIGPFGLVAFGDASFSPGKPDAADHVRTLSFAADCNCWKPADRFRRTQH